MTASAIAAALKRIAKWLDYGEQNVPTPRCTASDRAEADWKLEQHRRDVERWNRYWSYQRSLPVREYILNRGTINGESLERDIGKDEFVLGDRFPDITNMSWDEYETTIIPLVDAEIARRWGDTPKEDTG